MKHFESMTNQELVEFVDRFLSYSSKLDRKALLDLRTMASSLRLNSPANGQVFDRLSARMLYWNYDFDFALFDECIRRTQPNTVVLETKHHEVLDMAADGKIKFYMDGGNYMALTPVVRDLYNQRLIEVDKPKRVYKVTKTGELERVRNKSGEVDA